MALNPLYMTSPNLQEFFIDKDTGFPLAGGKVFYYSDVNREVYKPVYMLAGNGPNYSYAALPNPLTLSAWGTTMDNNRNDIRVYYYPYDDLGNPELYYIVVQNSLGVPQWTRQAWPNPLITSTTPIVGDSSELNLIPNGQFWLHTNVPNQEFELIGGSNIIAPGGFSVELPDTLHSTNEIQFIPAQFEEVPSQSPRFMCQFTCTNPSTLDAFKKFRIKFDDVNKFCATADTYTFAFNADANVNIPIAIEILKYCGTDGTVVPPIPIATDVIFSNDQVIYQYQFEFGSNAGYIIDLINNNDYIAIDISFPTNIGFNVLLTDFLLLFGAQVITGFPIQTSADMITRSSAGWMDNPDYTGMDLYLPVINTRYGQSFDSSVIGKIESTLMQWVSPKTINPLSTSIDMPCDGDTYTFAGYSNNGVPYARLGNALVEAYNASDVYTSGIPLTGTGVSFATAYIYQSDPNRLRLTVNTSGAGVAPADDVNTGFAISGIVTYGTSTTGSASFGYTANVQGSGDSLYVYSTFALTSVTAADDTNAPSLNLGPLDYIDGIYAQQGYAFHIDPLAASNLVAGSGMTAQYWTFSNPTTNYYMWFYFNGELDPAVGGATGIRLVLDASDDIVSTASKIREAINAYQMSDIVITAVPAAGTWWLFSTNPGASQNYYVWYAIGVSGTDPAIPGAIGIKVQLESSDTALTTVTKTQLAIDQFQYAAPDLRGLYLRSTDPNSTWDFDAHYRTSNISGFSGAKAGTFEYGQILSHYHVQHPSTLYDNVASQGNAPPTGTVSDNVGLTTENTGGSETRTVNYAVNYIIKY